MEFWYFGFMFHCGNAAKTLTETLVPCLGFMFQHPLDLWLVTGDQKS